MFPIIKWIKVFGIKIKITITEEDLAPVWAYIAEHYVAKTDK